MTVTPIGPSGQSVDMTTADQTFGQLGNHIGAQTAPAFLTLQQLSDAEQAMISRGITEITSKRYRLELHDAFFRGTQRIADLGISIPPQMRGLKIALGWPRVCVETLEERLKFEGFRFPGATDVDEDLQALLQANNVDSEAPLVHLDALVFGEGYLSVGSNADDPSRPILTVESPLDMAVHWDARTRQITDGVRIYGTAGAMRATLYKKGETVWAAADGLGGWVLDDSVEGRDAHGLDRVPLVRFANRARSYDRSGASEITPEVMSITDEASRTAQGLAVAREFYSAPQKYILGAKESDFQDAQGNTKSAWETYLGRVLALEADEDGNQPTVGQFTAYDPTVFTKVIEMYAKALSGVTGLPPHVLGYASDNPTSADAIIKGEMRLKLRADRKTTIFGDPWTEAGRLLLLFRDGSLPDNAELLTAVWGDTGTPTPAATTDAIAKQIAAGAIPAASDVTLERLGYSAVERQRLAQDRAADQGASFLEQIAHSVEAKAFRADSTLVHEAQAPATPTVKPADGNANAG